MAKVISAGIIIFRKTKNGVKFLLLYHGRNYWNFPKGKLEHEEKSRQAALREVQEETGIKVSDLRFVGNFKTYEKFFFRRGMENVFKLVILYLAETTQSQVTISEEHEGYGWFTFGEANRILTRHPGNIDILKRAYNFIRSYGRRQNQGGELIGENQQEQDHRGLEAMPEKKEEVEKNPEA